MWTEITRPKYERDGLRYASDLTEAEWTLIEPHMPRRETRGLVGVGAALNGPTLAALPWRTTTRRGAPPRWWQG